MIQVNLKFAGYFRKFLEEGKEYIRISLEKPSTIRDIFVNVGIDLKKVKVKPVIIVNGSVFNLDYVVKDGDEIILINMMVGG